MSSSIGKHFDVTTEVSSQTFYPNKTYFIFTILGNNNEIRTSLTSIWKEYIINDTLCSQKVPIIVGWIVDIFHRDYNKMLQYFRPIDI